MKCFKVLACLVGLAVAGSFAQVPNAQFKDLSGKSYDLYTLLGEGKSVYLHATASF